MDKAKDAVEEIFFSLSSMHELLGNMNPKLFYDLQKYHPKAWLFFRNFKEKSISKAILTNLERGIAEGLYREDIKKDILTQLRLDHVELIFNQHSHYTANKYSISQVMIEITEHFLYGICNAQGLEKIKYYKQQSTQAL
ncbi:MAG: hypothetical protein EON51_02345 [Acinetobacter sp.]|nr:MAG: hypothetical protein EON51_02345 [Acinetobacter sp.]